MQQMPIDVENGLSVAALGNRMGIPDFVVKRTRCHGPTCLSCWRDEDSKSTLFMKQIHYFHNCNKNLE